MSVSAANAEPRPEAGTTPGKEAPGANMVLGLSTISFTLMFAVWLMFGILGVPIQKEFGLSNQQLFWITSLAVLNGSLWRLPAGVLADRIGGRKVMIWLMLIGAVVSIAVSFANSYPMLLVLAFLVGFVGNSFSVGVSWNSAWFSQERKGFALGLFGAGNVGASVTKLIGPGIIAATAGSTYFLGIQGGWRLIPMVYAVLLIIMAVIMIVMAPRPDKIPASSQTIAQQLEPLKDIRVWRFGLYYVVVFGAYIAFSAYLPSYYVQSFGTSLGQAAMFTALFIFPASLLRPVGGWLSDKFGARSAMYGTFIAMLVTSGLLMMPNGHLVLHMPDGSERAMLHYDINIWWFTILVFILGCAMGIGKAAVYKHIPTYFPRQVGAVGGLVGMLGGLGGFFLPLMFTYTQGATGMWSSAFAILFLITLICLLWMHLVIHRMLHKASPELADLVERPDVDVARKTPDAQSTDVIVNTNEEIR